MLGVGKPFEEAVGSTQGGKSYFRPANERSEAFAVTLAGFAEEYAFDATAGAKGFFDEADAFDADGAGLRGKTAAKCHTELLEPAVVAAGEDSGRGSACGVACGFAWRGHQGERSKFRGREANPLIAETASLGRLALRWFCSGSQGYNGLWFDGGETRANLR